MGRMWAASGQVGAGTIQVRPFIFSLSYLVHGHTDKMPSRNHMGLRQAPSLVIPGSSQSATSDIGCHIACVINSGPGEKRGNIREIYSGHKTLCRKCVNGTKIITENIP
jgi:hypothetical protein